MAGIEDILDLTEAAQIAEVTPARLRQLIEAGQLRAKKVGNSWAVHMYDLESLLGRQRGPGRPDERSALARNLIVELRSNSPIYLSLVDPLPEILVGFKVDNRSSIEVEVDRLLTTVTFNGFPVGEGAVLDRFTIPPNKWNDGIQFRTYIDVGRVIPLRQFLANENSGQSLRVNATAYFNSPFGSVVVYNHMIDRRRGEFPVNLPPA
jgi:hypothetical protein